MRQIKTPSRELNHVVRYGDNRNKTQLKTWMKWYREGDMHRLEQPVGKNIATGRGRILFRVRKTTCRSKTLSLSWVCWVNCSLCRAPYSIAIKAASTHLRYIKKL